ncbi:MAG TPA: hypothetical protein DD621_05615 [Clostridiales bacterium]|nr:hypothetical protein [Clostridiales bacterium]
MLKSKFIYYILLILLPLLTLFTIINYFNVTKFSIVWLIIAISSIILAILSFIFYKKSKQIPSRLFFVTDIIIFVVSFVIFILNKYDMLEVFSSVATFKEFILSTKSKGMIIYVLVQYLQVLFVPIPSMIITLTGVAIYGPTIGSLLCATGVLLGSYSSFFIGKVFGAKIVQWIVGKDNAIKYADLISKKGKFFLIVAFLLPLFPDDILCMIAGITSMKFKDFFWIALVTRPIGVVCMSFFGGGYIIPFTGWGLFVWPFIIILAIAAVIIMTKYQENIESWIIARLPKFSKK